MKTLTQITKTISLPQPKFGFLAAPLIALGVFSAATTASAQTWDANADFSLASNPNGQWTYQYYNGTTVTNQPFADSAFNGVAGFDAWAPGDNQLPMVGKNNTVATHFGWAPGVLAMHPQVSNFQSVVTWTAPSAGQYSFASTFTWVGTGASNGVLTSVSQNLSVLPSSLGNMLIGGDSGNGNTYTLNSASPLTLSTGDTLSWLVDAYQGNNGNDSTVLDATVTAVPEASTTGFLILGSLFAGAVFMKNRRQHRA